MELVEAEEPNEVQVFNINGLPIEIMEKVYSYLPQHQVPSLCSVSKVWKEEVYNLYVLDKLIINEADSKMVRDRKCTTLIFKNLTSPLTQFQEGEELSGFLKYLLYVKKILFESLGLSKNSTQFQEREESGFLKYPLYVKEILFESPVQPEVMENIICSAGRLETLKFTSSQHINFSWVHTPKGSLGFGKLKDLRNLELDLTYGAGHDEQMAISDGINSVPLSLDLYFPKLFCIDLFGIPRIKSVAILVKKFIAKHAHTIKRITVHEHYVHSSLPLPYAPSNPQLEPDEVASLKRMKLEVFDVGTYWKDCWPIIVANFKEMIGLGFQYNSMAANANGTYGIPWIHFRSPIINSSTTLTDVVLCGISWENCQLKPFDFNIFEACHKLKVLRIEIHVFTGVQIQQNAPMIINPQKLPENLEELQFYNITILSADLVELLQHCNKLKKLRLELVGTLANLGVNSQVFFAMKNLQLLNAFLIEGYTGSEPGDLEYQMMDNIFAVLLDMDFDESYEMEFKSNAHALLQNRLSFLATVM